MDKVKEKLASLRQELDDSTARISTIEKENISSKNLILQQENEINSLKNQIALLENQVDTKESQLQEKDKRLKDIDQKEREFEEVNKRLEWTLCELDKIQNGNKENTDR